MSFVSNSSTSSFIISYRDDDSNLLSFMNKYIGNHCFDGNTEINREGAEDIIKDIYESIESNKRYGMTDFEKYKADQEKMIKLIQSEESKGKKIVDLSISYHDDLFNKILKDCVKSKKVKVIYYSES